MSENHVKHLHYVFEVYAEHFNEKQLDVILSKSLIPCIRSPLHKDDVYTEENYKKYKSNNDDVEPPWSIGDKKKPHWHVLFQCPFPKPRKSALSFARNIFPLLDVNYIIAEPFLNRACRYLCHLDSPDKTKYRRLDCKEFNGFVADFHKSAPYKAPVQVIETIISSVNTMSKPSLTALLGCYKDDEQVTKFIYGHTALVCRLIDERRGKYDN